MRCFKKAIEDGASDIHIKAGDVVRARLNGQLTPLTEQKISHAQVRELAIKLIPHEKDRERIDEITDYDCSWGLPGLGRFRVNILKQRGVLGIVMRIIAIEIPTFADLNLPPVLESISRSERGLILVTGVTGSGKSSTMAAIVGYINRNMCKHIITLEEPIEFLHRDLKSSITQRDVGSDTESFSARLRSALRQDPDVIMIGEMRDRDTIDTALKAAETGHLVISTVHTKNAVQTLSRIIAVFRPEEQEIVRTRLADSVQAVISQRLLPLAKGDGLVVAAEIMLVTGTIRDCIVDVERMEEIIDLIHDGREQYGSQTFDQHLMDLVNAGLVAFELAKAAANSPSDFDLKMNMLGQDRGSRVSSAVAEDSGGGLGDLGV
jgi:twitching motility protein PilT